MLFLVRLHRLVHLFREPRLVYSLSHPTNLITSDNNREQGSRRYLKIC